MNYREVEEFRTAVLSFYKEHGRGNLPWRKTRNPYRILVSEVMLQQTQVSRVVGKYKEFLKVFPSVEALARAPLSAVLKVWNGLGYNRRAKYLHDCAKLVVAEYNGNFKSALVHSLPGVGPYTRAAVRVFAFNEPHTMIETNIRTVFTHHFFKDEQSVTDARIVPVMERAAEGVSPREWHWALMDYGSYLKQSGIRINKKSAHYTKQSAFKGSLRQIRGEILKTLSNEGSINEVRSRYGEKTGEALKGLARDGLIDKRGNTWSIA